MEKTSLRTLISNSLFRKNRTESLKEQKMTAYRFFFCKMLGMPRVMPIRVQTDAAAKNRNPESIGSDNKINFKIQYPQDFMISLNPGSSVSQDKAKIQDLQDLRAKKGSPGYHNETKAWCLKTTGSHDRTRFEDPRSAGSHNKTNVQGPRFIGSHNKIR